MAVSYILQTVKFWLEDQIIIVMGGGKLYAQKGTFSATVDLSDYDRCIIEYLHEYGI